MATITQTNQANLIKVWQPRPTATFLALPNEMTSHIFNIITTMPNAILNFFSIQLTCKKFCAIIIAHPFYKQCLSINFQFHKKILLTNQFERACLASFLYYEPQVFGVLTKNFLFERPQWASRFVKLSKQKNKNKYISGHCLVSRAQRGHRFFLLDFEGLDLYRFKASQPSILRKILIPKSLQQVLQKTNTLIALSDTQCCILLKRKAILLKVKKDNTIVRDIHSFTPSHSHAFITAKKIGAFLVFLTQKTLEAHSLQTGMLADSFQRINDSDKVHLIEDGFLLNRFTTLEKYKITSNGSFKKEWTYLLPTNGKATRIALQSSPAILFNIKKEKKFYQCLLSGKKGKLIKQFSAKTLASPAATKEGICVVTRSIGSHQSLEICLVDKPNAVNVISLTNKWDSCQVLDMRIFKTAFRIHLGLLIQQQSKIFFVELRTPSWEAIT